MYRLPNNITIWNIPHTYSERVYTTFHELMVSFDVFMKKSTSIPEDQEPLTSFVKKLKCS